MKDFNETVQFKLGKTIEESKGKFLRVFPMRNQRLGQVSKVFNQRHRKKLLKILKKKNKFRVDLLVASFNFEELEEYTGFNEEELEEYKGFNEEELREFEGFNKLLMVLKIIKFPV